MLEDSGQKKKAKNSENGEVRPLDNLSNMDKIKKEDIDADSAVSGLSEEAPSMIMSFEERIEKLVYRGQKRGKRYSIIGIVGSVVVATVFIVGGYYLFTEIILLTNRVDRQGDPIALRNVLDPEGRCKNDECCIASLEKIRKNKFTEPTSDGICPLGQELSALSCSTTLIWCESLSEIKLPESSVAGIGTTSQPLNEATGTVLLIDSLDDAASSSDAENTKTETSSSSLEKASSSAAGLLQDEADADNDGLSDTLETIYGSDPQNPDSDGDGFWDGDEVKKGYNPNGPGKIIE